MQSGSQCVDAPPCGEGLTRDASGQCSPKQLQQCPTEGNPIQPALANKFQIEKDYVGAGESSISFIRTYNSVSVLVSKMGPQWRHSFDRTVQLRSTQTPAVANLFRADGRVLRFTQAGSVWTADADVSDRLVRLTNSSGLPTGWDYTVAADDSVERYDAAGTLLTITDRTGRVLRFSYSTGFGGVYPTTAPTCTPPAGSKGQLWCVTDSFGRKLHFTYSADRISKLIDPDGKQYLYAYSASGYLAAVTHPDAKVRTYHYNELAHTSGKGSANPS